MRLFDTHCHLNDQEAFPDPALVVHDAGTVGVDRLAVVGINARDSEAAVALAESFEGVYAIVGWHPNHAHEWSPEEWATIERLAKHPRVVAIGETGLDYHWDFATPKQQRGVYERHLELAVDTGKPLVIHCREALDDLITLMEQNRLPTKTVFHCFSGDATHAKRIIAMDGWFGLDGPLTYKKNDALRDLTASLPRDRVLLETDSPWLTPHPYRSERNSPSRLPLVNQALAACWQVTPDESARITTENALKFFGLD
ncbi:MAG: TatD family hydrolase [Fimbriimonadaceae bacterium]|nr:TatD family hydrolase [Fimbriimonadaceae bacterium]